MNKELIKDAVLRVGEVSGIEGRKVFITLDKNKNASDLFFDGAILKNVSVGSYIEIRKGFLSIIGKAEGEKLIEDAYLNVSDNLQYQKIDKNKRTLTINLTGFVNTEGQFIGGIKELPLIGNEAFLLTETKTHQIHNLLKKETSLKINVAKTDFNDVDINFPLDGLFNSHIAIFGNTGSGKSNTLAILYQEMIKVLKKNIPFKKNYKIFIFDFNGEYAKDDCITSDKKVYNLSTRTKSEERIPMTFDEIMDIETLSIILEATEKTQKPFLKRSLRYYRRVKQSRNLSGENDFLGHFKNIVKLEISNVLKMTDKDLAFKILDYLEEIIGFFFEDVTGNKLREDIGFHNTFKFFYLKTDDTEYSTNFSEHKEFILETNLYKEANVLLQTEMENWSSHDSIKTEATNNEKTAQKLHPGREGIHPEKAPG